MRVYRNHYDGNFDGISVDADGMSIIECGMKKTLNEIKNVLRREAQEKGERSPYRQAQYVKRNLRRKK